jgi:hypothetical protein
MKPNLSLPHPQIKRHRHAGTLDICVHLMDENIADAADRLE